MYLNNMKHKKQNIKTFEGFFGTKINVDAECDTCKEGKVKCINCSSDGRDREACNVCRGTGWVDCPDCNGLSDCECGEEVKENRLNNLSKNVNEMYGLPTPTKNAEYRRTLEMFNDIFKSKGMYFSLAFLYDSGYTNEDIKKMMELMVNDTKNDVRGSSIYGLKDYYNKEK